MYQSTRMLPHHPRRVDRLPVGQHHLVLGYVRGDRIKPAVIVTDDRTLGHEQLMLVSYTF